MPRLALRPFIIFSIVLASLFGVVEHIPPVGMINQAGGTLVPVTWLIVLWRKQPSMGWMARWESFRRREHPA
jgi:hypothetical protein